MTRPRSALLQKPPSGTQARPLLLAALGLMTLSLAGCTVPLTGVLGLSLNSNDSPIAVIQMCIGDVDSVVVYAGAGGNSDRDVWRLTLTKPVSGFGEIPIGSNGSGPSWAQPGIEYVIYATSKDASSSTTQLPFTVADLAGLSRDSVLIPNEAETKTKSVARSELKAIACERN